MANSIQEQESTTNVGADTKTPEEEFKLLKAHFAQYKTFSGQEVQRLRRISSGSIIKLFEHTPYPTANSDVVCPHFLELKWGYGCPFDCAWCFLKGTLRMLPEKTAPKTKPRRSVERHVKSALIQTKHPEMFNSGEICDSLMDERNGGEPFSQWIIDMFDKQVVHKILILTKSSYINKMLQIENHRQAVASFSLNAYKVARKWEKAPTPKSRIEAGQKLSENDWEVRVRIDPIVPINDWKKAYKELIEDLFSAYSPSRITLGTPRGLQSTLNNVTDKSWIAYLDNGRSGWGRKVADGIREDIYREIFDLLEYNISLNKVGLCKETLEMFSILDRDFRKQVCNCMM